MTQPWEVLWSSHTVNVAAPPAKITTPADAIVCLALKFTPNARPIDDGVTATALAMAETFDAATAKVFLDQVVFNAAHPEAHLYLWYTISRCTPAATCEAEILARVKGTNALHQVNAFALVPAVFGVIDGYVLSAAGREQLVAAAKVIADDVRGAAALREAARGFLTRAPAAPPVDHVAAVAKSYDTIGGGARDRTHRVVQKAASGKPTSTRSAAPLLSGADFAKKCAALEVAEDVSTFLPKLKPLPEQMRILTLEAIYAAQSADDVKDIIAQTASML